MRKKKNIKKKKKKKKKKGELNLKMLLGNSNTLSTQLPKSWELYQAMAGAM